MPTRKKKQIKSSGYMTVAKASTAAGKGSVKGMNAKGNKSYCPKLSKL